MTEATTLRPPEAGEQANIIKEADKEKDKYVRIKPEAHRQLKIIAATIGESMVSCVDSALDDWIDRHVTGPATEGGASAARSLPDDWGALINQGERRSTKHDG